MTIGETTPKPLENDFGGLMKKLVILILILFFPIFLQADNTEIENKFLLQKQKAGNIEIGETIDQLYKQYGRNSTKLVDLYLEGMFSPAIEIYL